jgi:hypothetical protein
MKATGAHISLNGHITREELRTVISQARRRNGWGNRFLFCATKRARKLRTTMLRPDEQ